MSPPDAQDAVVSAGECTILQWRRYRGCAGCARPLARRERQRTSYRKTRRMPPFLGRVRRLALKNDIVGDHFRKASHVMSIEGLRPLLESLACRRGAHSQGLATMNCLVRHLRRFSPD